MRELSESDWFFGFFCMSVKLGEILPRERGGLDGLSQTELVTLIFHGFAQALIRYKNWSFVVWGAPISLKD